MTFIFLVQNVSITLNSMDFSKTKMPTKASCIAEAFASISASNSNKQKTQNAQPAQQKNQENSDQSSASFLAEAFTSLSVSDSNKQKTQSPESRQQKNQDGIDTYRKKLSRQLFLAWQKNLDTTPALQDVQGKLIEFGDSPEAITEHIKSVRRVYDCHYDTRYIAGKVRAIKAAWLDSIRRKSGGYIDEFHKTGLINQKSSNNVIWTALQGAWHEITDEFIQFSLSTEPYGLTQLELAVLLGKEEVVEKYLPKDPDDAYYLAMKRSPYGSLLHCAIHSRNLNLIKKIITILGSYAAKVGSYRDDDGNNVVNLTILLGNKDFLEYLMDTLYSGNQELSQKVLLNTNAHGHSQVMQIIFSQLLYEFEHDL